MYMHVSALSLLSCLVAEIIIEIINLLSDVFIFWITYSKAKDCLYIRNPYL